eukprot:TRINITY_DN1658_c0_g1_i1.p1 TRINITY_DN1658_c0_g1~~TRINITY_DN1658_c0_g1_i1.p1  ORF type:complete len:501 (+),score=79.79 TRINITY_DN1658_c0_g1_i1:717-2219(+)
MTVCEGDGSFSPKQCLGSRCWCVDSEGKNMGVEGSITINCYTPCLERQRSEKTICGKKLGCKITKCESDGSFSPQQCHGSVCSCVKSDGSEISNTNTRIWKRSSCKCFRQLSDDEIKCGGLGCFKTQCQADGSFSPKQCYGSECWCVDSYGKRLSVNGARSASCETPCLQTKALDMRNCGGRLGCKITQCEADGSFSPQQCHGSICRCMDSRGKEINGTSTMIGKIHSCACVLQRSDDEFNCGGYGCFKTQCEADATFSPRQCHGSKCWCVDASGKKLGTEGDQNLNCGYSCTERATIESQMCGGRLGCFVSKCKEDGSFSNEQCFGSQCWCVDSNGINVIGTERSIGTNTTCPGACELKNKLDIIKCGSKLGCFITQCAADGSFISRQCFGSECWCVDRNGAPVLGTTHPIEDVSICIPCELRLKQDEERCGGMGCFKTQCEPDGSYSPKQCLGANCWCVDMQGQEIKGSNKNIGYFANVNCKCFREKSSGDTTSCNPM